MSAFAFGIAIAGAVFFGLGQLSLSTNRAALLMIFLAIAAIYPVFALAWGDWPEQAQHLQYLAAQVFVATAAYRIGPAAIAALISAHGGMHMLLQGQVDFVPVWWFAFGGGFELSLGFALLANTWMVGETA